MWEKHCQPLRWINLFYFFITSRTLALLFITIASNLICHDQRTLSEPHRCRWYSNPGMGITTCLFKVNLTGMDWSWWMSPLLICRGLPSVLSWHTYLGPGECHDLPQNRTGRVLMLAPGLSRSMYRCATITPEWQLHVWSVHITGQLSISSFCATALRYFALFFVCAILAAIAS